MKKEIGSYYKGKRAHIIVERAIIRGKKEALIASEKEH